MLAPTLPDIVFVPGFWEGASVYDKCSELLRKVGYTVYVASLLSTGTSFTETPKSPSLADDVARIRSLIEQLVNLEHELILVCHSAGGFLGSHAIEGLSASARKRNGLNGGVLRLAFLAGAVFPEGTFHEDLWFFDIEGDKLFCKSPREFLFNDIASDIEANLHVSRMHPQPAKGWNGFITYGGWKEVSSSYLVCEKDAVLSSELQRQFAEVAGSDVIESCDAGHMAHITASDEVTDFIRRAAGEPYVNTSR